MQRLYGLPEQALIDMGDFVGGTLKYLRAHPVPRLTLAGGFAKLAKLAAGHLDLHSSRSRVDPAASRALLADAGARAGDRRPRRRSCDSAGEILDLAGALGPALAEAVARRAREVALATLSGDTAVEVAIVDRAGAFLAHVGAPDAARSPHDAPRHLLILGGTGEAAALARAALARFGDAIEVTTALAGRTRNPGPIAGDVRIGGFGGPAGLAAYLRRAPDRPADRRDPPVRRRDLAHRPARRRARRGAAAAAAAPAVAAPSARPLDRGRQHRGRGAAGRPDRPVRLADRRRRVGRRLRAGQRGALYRAADRSAARRSCRCGTTRSCCGRGPFSLADERQLLRHHGDRRARMQGERRRRHRGEADRGARGSACRLSWCGARRANRGEPSTRSRRRSTGSPASIDRQRSRGGCHERSIIRPLAVRRSAVRYVGGA